MKDSAQPIPGPEAGALGQIGALDEHGNLRIEGTVSGPVCHSGSITVGPHGSVFGKISAPTITIAGEVQGDLHAEALIRVETTGRVRGDLHAPRIAIDTGGRVKGRFVMRSHQEAAQELGETAVNRLLSRG
jgi:cytoskeletal protein CcmA (bactofilin family)